MSQPFLCNVTLKRCSPVLTNSFISVAEEVDFAVLLCADGLSQDYEAAGWKVEGDLPPLSLSLPTQRRQIGFKVSTDDGNIELSYIKTLRKALGN